MNIDAEKLVVNGVTYVPESSVSPAAKKLDGLEYKIVRCDRSGVFAGYIESEEGRTIVIRQSRNLYYWDGAATLAQLAEEGVSKPKNCKFPQEVTKIKVLDAIQILDCTEVARKSISEVPVWKA